MPEIYQAFLILLRPPGHVGGWSLLYHNHSTDTHTVVFPLGELGLTPLLKTQQLEDRACIFSELSLELV